MPNLEAPYAHNLVSALYAMKGLLETCLRQEEGAAPEVAESVLKRAYGQADQALRIAKRLGSLTILGEKKTRRCVRASVRRAWERARAIVKGNASSANVEILKRIPDSFPMIQCNARDLAEIFYHLAVNALQAMKGTGKLIVRSEMAFSTAEVPFARIQIADTGPGIAPSGLANLFLPFYSTKAPSQGNGLGLYLTRQLVRRNGGQITASSSQGLGTTFTLEFPPAPKR